jgi:hypothetical protein
MLVERCPKLRAVFYTSNTGNNVHFLRFNELTHVFLGHGDSEKAASCHKYFRVYDEVWTAGQAHIDRFHNSGVDFSAVKFVPVGRPTLRPQLANPQVPHEKQFLYLPTWEGFNNFQNYSSVTSAPSFLLTAVRASGSSPIVKYHPLTGTQNSSRVYSEPVLNEAFVAANEPIEIVPRSQGVEPLMPRADFLVSDISSVVTDFLVFQRPIFLYEPQNAIRLSASQMKYSDYTYMYNSAAELERLIEQVIVYGDDYLAPARLAALNYFIGVEETLNDVFGENVRRVCKTPAVTAAEDAPVETGTGRIRTLPGGKTETIEKAWPLKFVAPLPAAVMAGFDSEGALEAEAVFNRQPAQGADGAFSDVTLRAIAEARASGDHAAIVRHAAAFNELRDPADIFDRNLLKIHIASVQALLDLGLPDDAAAKVQWIKSVYGLQPSAAHLSAKLLQLNGDTAAAIAEVDDGICAQPSSGSERELDRLLLLKAELLLARGDAAEARTLLATQLLRLQSAELFDLLRRTIAQPGEVALYENIVLPQLPSLGPNVRHALQNYGQLLREFGAADRANTIARERFLSIIAHHSFASIPEVRTGRWKREAEVALCDLQDDLKTGPAFFLIRGTLLAATRDKAFLPYGHNIDLGVAETVTLDSVVAALKASKRFVVRAREPSKVLTLEHLNGVRINIYRHHARDGRIYHENSTGAWSNTAFDLESVSFLDREFAAPADADRYLTETYGEWLTPQSEFDAYVDTLNMEVRDPQRLAWRYLINLGDCFLSAKLALFQRTWRALAALTPIDPLLTATVLDVAADPGKYRRHDPIHVVKPEASEGGEPVEMEAGRAEEPSEEGEDDYDHNFLPLLEPLTATERSSPLSPARLFTLLALRIGLVGRLSLRMGLSGLTNSEAYRETRRLNQLVHSAPGDRGLQNRFVRAAILAGRGLQTADRSLDACKVWYAVRQIPSAKALADRSLVVSALKGARTAEAAGDRQTALWLWRYLQLADPNSVVAAKGIERCSWNPS